MSLTQAEIKKYRSLKVKKYRDQYGLFIAEGVKVCEEGLKSGYAAVILLVKGSISNEERIKQLMSLASSKSVAVEVVKDKIFEELSSLETSPGVLVIFEKFNVKNINLDRSCLVIDDIKDPGNLGTNLRTADWFGINNVVISSESVDIYNPKVIQGSMGSIFHLNILQDQDLIQFLKNLQNLSYDIIATTLQGESKLNPTKKKFALLVGNEAQGLNQELLQYANINYKIPGDGQAESLNVSVATGIILDKLINC